MEKLTNNTVIKTVSNNQREILTNIMSLYNGGNGFDCDITASTLKFYEQNNKDGFNVPIPKFLFDVNPTNDNIKKMDAWGEIPLNNESIGSIVIDLPFVISPRDCKSVVEKYEGSNLIQNRFSSYYPVREMYESYYHWIKESYRVLRSGGVCVFKTQSTISGGIQHNTEEWSFMCAQRAGFTVEDKFILTAKSRLISGKYVKQKHARKYSSVFYVFIKKDDKFSYNSLMADIEKNPIYGKIEK